MAAAMTALFSYPLDGGVSEKLWSGGEYPCDAKVGDCCRLFYTDRSYLRVVDGRDFVSSFLSLTYSVPSSYRAIFLPPHFYSASSRQISQARAATGQVSSISPRHFRRKSPGCQGGSNKRFRLKNPRCVKEEVKRASGSRTHDASRRK